MQQFGCFAKHQGQAGLPGHDPRRSGSIDLAVSLCARSLHSRPLAAIQQPELDAGGIGQSSHDTVKRIDFTHQVAFSQPANRGIAGHRTQIIAIQRYQRGFRAHARSSHGGFQTGMASTNHDYVELFHVKPYFPIQKELKISSR